jgi:hypothetical protein
MKDMTVGQRSRKDKLDDLLNNSESDLEPLHIRLQKRHLGVISELSENHGVSKAEVVRRLVDKGLQSVLGQSDRCDV